MEDRIKKEREKMLSDRLEIIEGIRAKLDFFNVGSGNYFDVQNIGITFNNKIVEIINIYKRYNKEIVDSKLFSLMYNHLIKMVFTADDIINKMVDYLNEEAIIIQNKSKNEPNYSSKEDIEATINYLKEELVVYNAIDNSIFHFDIEKNIMDAFNTELKRTKEIEEDGGFSSFSLNKNKYIEEYNRELNELGYSITLPYDNVKKQGL